MLKTSFWGTPAIAVPFLEQLLTVSDVRAVVTNPDEPAGRGYALTASPVKQAALSKGLSLYQPETLSDPAFQETWKGLETDVAIIVAYGKLLPSPVLAVPRHGFLNIHFSLLPEYRGAAPVQRALMAGELETGVTLFWLDAGMDTGPIFLKRSLAIHPNENAPTLFDRLVPMGVTLLAEAIKLIADNRIVRTPQEGAGSVAPKIQKAEAQLDWTQPALTIHNRVRGLWPRAFTAQMLDGKRRLVKVLKTQVEDRRLHQDPAQTACGQIVDVSPEEGVAIMCGKGIVRLLEVQPEGKKPMSAWAFWQGARLQVNDFLGDTHE